MKNLFPLLFPGPPIVSEEELASLAMISPAKTSQYAGSRVKALIHILQHQLDQQELVREFMVGIHCVFLIHTHAHTHTRMHANTHTYEVC